MPSSCSASAAVSDSKARGVLLPGYPCDVTTSVVSPVWCRPFTAWPGRFCTCHDDSLNYPKVLLNDFSVLPLLVSVGSWSQRIFTHNLFAQLCTNYYVLRTVLSMQVIQGAGWKNPSLEGYSLLKSMVFLANLCQERLSGKVTCKLRYGK